MEVGRALLDRQDSGVRRRGCLRRHESCCYGLLLALVGGRLPAYVPELRAEGGEGLERWWFGRGWVSIERASVFPVLTLVVVVAAAAEAEVSYEETAAAGDCGDRGGVVVSAAGVEGRGMGGGGGGEGGGDGVSAVWKSITC